MLILVAVSINILIESDLIGAAEKAANAYKTAEQQEQELYVNISDYLNQMEENPGDNPPTPPTPPTTITPEESTYAKKGNIYCNTPDLSGFNPDCTYYVTYDENGENEQIGSKIILNEDGEPTNMPQNWYDYENKKWANIVTINNNLTTYWTYIPRYEYNISNVNQTVLPIFISVEQETADPGYTIPDAFTFGGEPLKGYWVSKYEVQGTIE